MGFVSDQRDIKRLEKSYNDKFKAQSEVIIKLQGEILRIKDLVKKFLTPEQMKQISLFTNLKTAMDNKNQKSETGLGELTIEMVEGEHQSNTELMTTSESQQHVVSDIHQLY